MRILHLSRQAVPLTAAFGLLGAIAVGSWWGTRHILGQLNGGGLVVSQDSLDFGDAWSTDRFLWKVPIQNPTHHDIRVVNFRASCSCTDVTPNSFVVPPGGTVEVDLTLDLTNTGQASPVAPNPQAADPAMEAVEDKTMAKDLAPSFRPFGVDLMAVVAGKVPQVVTWRVTGRIRDCLTFDPPLVEFGDSLVRGGEPQVRLLTVRSHPHVTELDATWDPALGKVRVLPSAAAGRFELELIPRTDLPLGNVESAVEVSGALASGEVLPPLRVPVSGRVVDDVKIRPASLSLGTVEVGQVIEETVVLASSTGKAIEIDSADSQGKGLSVHRLKNASAFKQFAVQQLIAQRGQQSGQVTFLVRAAHESQPREVTLPVSYYGIEANALPKSLETEDAP